jgi:DNA-binding CsgD family transcriptional regulator
MMQVFHIVMTIWVAVNGVLFGWLFFHALRIHRRTVSQLSGLLALVLALVSATFVIGSIQRLGLQAVEADLLPEGARTFFLTAWQLVLTAMGTTVAIVVLPRIGRAVGVLDRSERMVNVLIEQTPHDVDPAGWGLTRREHEVLELIGRGELSDAAIAEALFISAATAATHVRNILRKTGFSSRNELMFAAVSDADARSRGGDQD